MSHNPNMNGNSSVDFSGFDQSHDWNAIKEIFLKYGPIQRLYKSENGGFGTVFFKECSSAEKVFSELHNKPPLNLQLRIVERKHEHNTSQGSDQNHQLNNSLKFTKTMDPSTGNRPNKKTSKTMTLVKVFDQEIQVHFINGKQFVLLDDLKAMGFNFFENGQFPSGNKEVVTPNQYNAATPDLNASKQLRRPHQNYESPRDQKKLDDQPKQKYRSPRNQNSFNNHNKDNERGASFNASNQYNSDSSDVEKIKKPYQRKNFDNKNEPVVRKSKFPRLELNLQGTYNIIVSNINDDGTFSGFLSENKSILEDILKKLVPGKEKVIPLVNPQVDDICQAEYEDTMYRAQILSVDPLKVVYVDYGNRNSEKLENVYLLDDSLKGIEAQAVNFVWNEGHSENIKDYDEIKIVIIGEKSGSYIVQKYIEEAPEKKSKRVTMNQLKSQPNNSKTPTEKNAPSLLAYDIKDASFDIVSSVNDKEHVVFVVANELFGEIQELSVIPKPERKLDNAKAGDIVGVVHDSDKCIVRAKILGKWGALFKVSLMDYGELKETTDVYNMPDKYHDYPQFIVVCFCDLNSIRKGTTLSWKANSKKAKLSLENGEVTIDVKEWEISQEIPKYFGPVPEATLTDNADVKIVQIGADYLVVRSKEAFNLLKEINKELSNLKDTDEFLPGPVKQEQLVTYFEEKAFRALVLEASDVQATILLIDLGEVRQDVSYKAMKNTTQRLAKFPSTLAKLTLKDYEDKFDEHAVAILKDYQEKKQAFKVKKTSQSSSVVLTLPSGETLVDQLRSRPTNKVFFKDVPIQTVHVGQKMDMLVLYVDKPFVFLYEPKTNLYLPLLEAINTFVGTQEKLPHISAKDEIILYKDDETDEWVRGVVRNFNSNGSCDVEAIDFGSKATVSSSLIISVSKEVATIPRLGLKCELVAGDIDAIEIGMSIQIEIISKKATNHYCIKVY